MPIARWITLSALLLAEVLFLTFRFDTASLENSNSWWIGLAANSPAIFQVLLAILTASMLIAGASILSYLRIHADLGTIPRRMWSYLFLHLGCFILLYWISLSLFSGNASVLNSPLWPIAWFAAIFGMAYTWGGMLLPGAVYSLIIKKYWKLLLASSGLGVLGWGVGAYTNRLFDYLGYATFYCSGQLLRLFTADIVCNWNMHELGTSGFSVCIDKACSGYEGMGLILVFLAAYLWLFRSNLMFPRALLLLPAGVLAAWLMNCLRIWALILVGTYVSADIALGGFHSRAGALLFCCLALGMAWASHHSRWVSKRVEPHSSDNNAILTVAYLAPFMSILAVAMITGLASTGFDYLYPIRILVASFLLWRCRKYYELLRFKVSWIPIAAGMGVLLFWLALSPAPAEGSTAAFANSLKAIHPLLAALWLIFRIIGSSAVVPLVEEIAFRGYLTRRIISADFSKIPMGQFSWLSFILSSVLFGLMHQRWFAGILAGFVYALVLYRRRNLADAVISHATTNFALSIYILCTKQWHLWI